MLNTEPPSSGGSGSRLNVPRITFSISMTDSSVPMKPASPPAADATTRLKLALSGATKNPASSPALISTNATSASMKLPAGPAAAISAARCG